jgi:hypothetical protein
MLKILLRPLIAILITCSTVGPSLAEYFSNMGGAQTVEAQQTSAEAFAGMALLMSGLSALELADEAGAKSQLTAATSTIKEAAGQFQLLSEKYANLPLDVKFPDALTELAQTSEVSAEKIATAGDVLALTSQSLTTTADVLDKFVDDPTTDNYTALRKSIENTLRIGDLSSKLLQ